MRNLHRTKRKILRTNGDIKTRSAVKFKSSDNVISLSFFTKIASLITTAISIFFLSAIVGYSIDDPSMLNVKYNDYSSQKTKIANIAGRYGAYVADPIMQTIGYASLLPITMALIASIRTLLNKRRRTITISKIAIMLFTIPLVSICLAYIDANELSDTTVDDIRCGGFVGHYLQTELSLKLNGIIVFIMVSILATIGVFISLNITLAECVSIFFYIAKHAIILFLMFIKYLLFAWWSKKKNTYTKADKKIADIEHDDYFGDSSYNKQDNDIEAYDPKTCIKKINDKKNVSTKLKLSSYGDSECRDDIFNHNGFILPSMDLLHAVDGAHTQYVMSSSEIDESSKKLMQVLGDFSVRGELIAVSPGPVVVLYEIEPAAGTKSSRIIGLADDIARSMSAISARVYILPGKNAVGIELPSKKRNKVYLRELLEDKDYTNDNISLPLALGKDISGIPMIVDLAKMPHLLMAGTTGSGKSVAIHSMILSLLYRHSPQTCRFIMIDPKILELSLYNNIPHMLSPVVTDVHKATSALKWAINEMESRYKAMSTLGVRNIDGYNELIERAAHTNIPPQKQIQVGFDAESDKPIFETVSVAIEFLPYIVIVIDEMADLMIVAGKEVDSLIQRLAQMARAAGIHMILATQRPSVDVISGTIKANFPARISLQTASAIDSTTVLGTRGAEKLFGAGDMLYAASGKKPQRVHGPFVSDNEVEKIVSYLKKQSPPVYKKDLVSVLSRSQNDNGFDDVSFARMIQSGGGDGDNENINSSDNDNYNNGGDAANYDDSTNNNDNVIVGNVSKNDDLLYKSAIEYVIRDKRPTISYLQRRLRVGYNKAALFIERMEASGIVSAPDVNGKRQILLNSKN